ncbi:flagellar protein FliT [Evansella cellulosilytica]|uniref:Flagellar protein FliT n=1 Tax=Evansella cellulosilytica (strain ATCC 21833 / DSM 2522 / FERM P-1141 / JCM 9156 / N-4) TaxID=649639 RepID=E6TS71_EVAC2|nr:flagellar protein FliT [Evansella cellulosilytica]ADU31840.1 hypothetical protein Bcell_3599 [Evansella cellulosilytica DSM 2522]
MNEFVKLYEVTKELFDHVNTSPDKEAREDYIEKLNALIEKRASIITSITREATDKEKLLLKQAANLNEQMTQKLQEVLHAIKRDMQSLKKKKDTGQRYENPYNYAPIDGAFIDKKN